MFRGFAWAEWGILRTAVPLLLLLQVSVLAFFGIETVERLLLSQEPALLELRPDHTASTAQEFHIFLRQFPPVLRTTYRTREQQLLALQAMFPDADFAKQDPPFRDALLVHLRSPRDYRSLLGTVMAERRWQDLLSHGSLLRLGEQVQMMQRFTTAFRLLRAVPLTFALLFSCALFLLLLRSARRFLGPDGENAPLQEFLGASPLSIVGPVACRMTIILFACVLFSFLVPSSAALLLPLESLTFLRLSLVEGLAALLLSVGGVLLSRHVPYLPLRRARSPDV